LDRKFVLCFFQGSVANSYILVVYFFQKYLEIQKLMAEEEEENVKQKKRKRNIIVLITPTGLYGNFETEMFEKIPGITKTPNIKEKTINNLHLFSFKPPNIYIIIFSTAYNNNNNNNNIIMYYMLNNFVGTHYRLADNWFNHIDVSNYSNKQINYLEIGTFYGANILSVAKTYGLHNDSKLYCIDPWEDYDDYPEYKNQQPSIYNSFVNNIENSGVKDKIIINRGYSNLEIPKFQDDFFDIIYIDGNHEPEYVLEDAVLSFRKLKKNGIMIFDDYGWGGPDLTQKGIDGFLSGYHKRINYLGERGSQVFIKKI